MLKEPEDKDPDEDEDQNKKIKGEEQYIGKQGMPQSKFTYVGGSSSKFLLTMCTKFSGGFL